MPDERKFSMESNKKGKRSKGGQKKRYKDTLNAPLKDFDMPIQSWEQAALELSKWRDRINKGGPRGRAGKRAVS